MTRYPTLGPARPAPSPLVLATLALVWAAAFGLLVAAGADAAYDAAHWHGPAGPARAGSPAGLGAALPYLALGGMTAIWSALLLPVFGLTWLALPRRECRTFPVVAALWMVAVVGVVGMPALSPALASAAATLVLAIPLGITGEVLRSVATAIVCARDTADRQRA